MIILWDTMTDKEYTRDIGEMIVIRNGEVYTTIHGRDPIKNDHIIIKWKEDIDGENKD